MNGISERVVKDKAIDYIGKGQYFHWAAFDTSLIIGSKQPFYEFKIFERRILWINTVIGDSPSKCLAPRIVFKCSPKNPDGIKLTNQIASLFCYLTRGTAIAVVTCMGAGNLENIAMQPPQGRPYGLAYPQKEFSTILVNENPKEYSANKWVALAHYRQAVTSNTPYYEYLSYWKIIELRFDNNTESIKSYLGKFFEHHSQKVKEVSGSCQNPIANLWATRGKVAHFAQLSNKDYIIQNPDDPDTYIDVFKNCKIMRCIVGKLLAEML